jgi:hypothetical protein
MESGSMDREVATTDTAREAAAMESEGLCLRGKPMQGNFSRI